MSTRCVYKVVKNKLQQKFSCKTICIVLEEHCLNYDFLVGLLSHSALQHGSPWFRCYKTNRKQKVKRTEHVFQSVLSANAEAEKLWPCPWTFTMLKGIYQGWDATGVDKLQEFHFVNCRYLWIPTHLLFWQFVDNI